MSETTVVNLAQTATPTETTGIPGQNTSNAISQTPANNAIVDKKPDEMASKFAALAKKERQARQLVQQSRSRADELARREAAIAKREQEWESEFRNSPLEALKKRNLTYQDLTNAALNDGKFQPETEIKRVQDEIQRFRKETEEKEKRTLAAQTQAQRAAESEAVNAFKSRISEHVDKNGDKLELTKLYNGEDLVFQTVEEYYNRTQKILSVEEASDLVEQYLEAELERTSKESKKFQSKYLAQKSQEARSNSRSDVTLSNNLNTSAAPTLLSQKTEEDRLKRALAALG